MGKKRGSTRKKLKEMTPEELRRDLKAVNRRRKHLSSELRKRIKK